MFTKRHATLANASILLYFAALASGIVLRSGHVNTLRSCSSLFTYQTRPDDGRTYGLIIVAQPFAEMLADGRMLLDVWLQADGIVPKDSFQLRLFLNRMSTIRRIRKRRSIRYVVDFPLQSSLPVVMSIMFNGRRLCEPMEKTFGVYTEIRLHHMLRTGLNENNVFAGRPSSLGFEDGYNYMDSAPEPLAHSKEQFQFGTHQMPETASYHDDQFDIVDSRPYQYGEQHDNGYNYHDIADDHINGDQDDDVGIGDYVSLIGDNARRPERRPAIHAAYDNGATLLQPPQCENQTFCDHVADYPLNYVESLIGIDSEQGYDERLYTEPEPDELFSRFRGDGQSIEAEVMSLCHARQQLIWPKTGVMSDNSWVFIVNSDRLKQGVSVETCIDSGSRCEYAQFPRKMRSGCHQKYGYRKMLTFRDVTSKPETTNIKLPVGCECQVWFDQ